MRRTKPPVPTLWLFTDERVADAALFAALHRLPHGSGVIFRHYALLPAERERLARRVWAITRKRRLVLLLAAMPRLRADGVHRPAFVVGRRYDHGLISASAHDGPEARRAFRYGADLIFLSPVFATRSHPAADPLGALGFAAIARSVAGPAMALGGMTAARFRRLKPLGAAGYGAIDALS